jgi:hypothetical protein
MVPDNTNKGSANAEAKAEHEGRKLNRPRRRTMLDILIYVCGTLVLIGSLCLGYLGVSGGLKNQRILGLVILYGTLFFVLTGAFLFFYQRLRVQLAESAQKSKPFAVTIGGQWAQEERTLLGSQFWLSYSWQGRATISPIHRLMFIRITNRQSVKSMIETYRVEAENAKGEWVQLVWMDGQLGPIYMLSGDIRKAMLLSVPKLDSALTYRAMNPNETVEGWAFFEIPENVPAKSPLRIYVKDMGGAEITETVRNIPPDSFRQAGDMFKAERTLDLSDDNPVAWYYSKIISGATP